MKKISITVVLLTLASLALFAEGSREQPNQQWGPGQGMYQGSGDFTGEIVTVTGKLAFAENSFPELKSGNETYELMYHNLNTSDLDIEEGDTITVKGFLVPGPRWNNDEDEKHLMLTEATIGGKEYILADSDDYYCGTPMGGAFNGHGGRGRGSMMGGSFGGSMMRGSFGGGKGRW